jgi:hypothetical protein
MSAIAASTSPTPTAHHSSPLGKALVALSLLASACVPPILWFNTDHARNLQWHWHARFHMLWTACLLFALGALALFALRAWWDREPKIRVVLAGFPVVIALTYFFAGLVLAPRLGIANPFYEATPLIFFGINIKVGGWVVLMIASLGGYFLDQRSRFAMGTGAAT